MVVCDIKCGYQVDGFCTKPLVSINRFGQCTTWFDDTSNLRPANEVARLEENFSNRRTFVIEDLEIEENQMEKEGEN